MDVPNSDSGLGGASISDWGLGRDVPNSDSGLGGTLNSHSDLGWCS